MLGQSSEDVTVFLDGSSPSSWVATNPTQAAVGNNSHDGTLAPTTIGRARGGSGTLLGTAGRKATGRSWRSAFIPGSCRNDETHD